MEIFGAVAATITLGAELVRISGSLRKAVRSIRYARRDIESLAEEIGLFSGLYENFLDACPLSSGSEAHSPSSNERLISWTRAAIRDYKKLRKEVGALARDPNPSLLDTVAAHVRWYFRETTVKYLRASLCVARESITGLTNIRAIEKLDEQLSFLKSVLSTEQKRKIEIEYGMPVEQYVPILEARR